MRSAIGTYEAFEDVVEGLANGGILLTTGEQGNPMTIGWGMLGRIWSKPVFTVLVRPSRYSFGLLEALPEFAVNGDRTCTAFHNTKDDGQPKAGPDTLFFCRKIRIKDLLFDCLFHSVPGIRHG